MAEGQLPFVAGPRRTSTPHGGARPRNQTGRSVPRKPRSPLGLTGAAELFLFAAKPASLIEGRPSESRLAIDLGGALLVDRLIDDPVGLRERLADHCRRRR